MAQTFRHCSYLTYDAIFGIMNDGLVGLVEFFVIVGRQVSALVLLSLSLLSLVLKFLLFLLVPKMMWARTKDISTKGQAITLSTCKQAFFLLQLFLFHPLRFLQFDVPFRCSLTR